MDSIRIHFNLFKSEISQWFWILILLLLVFINFSKKIFKFTPQNRDHRYFYEKKVDWSLKLNWDRKFHHDTCRIVTIHLFFRVFERKGFTFNENHWRENDEFISKLKFHRRFFFSYQFEPKSHFQSVKLTFIEGESLKKKLRKASWLYWISPAEISFSQNMLTLEVRPTLFDLIFIESFLINLISSTD